MSPRPRTITDADILAAAGKTIIRMGPAKMTLAAVARDAGLAPATLMQRFGSKRGLLLALANAALDDVEPCFQRTRATKRSPLAALIAAATDMTQYVTSPEQLANSLAFLQMDLSDPDFSAVAAENSRRMLGGYRRLLDEAVKAGELVPCNTARLARAVSAIAGGSLVGWALMRKGAAATWVRSDVETLLAPYRSKRG
jgi:AcrR family transcriptional regulator